MSLIAAALIMAPVFQETQVVIPLWANGAPGSESRRMEPETKPHPWSIGNIQNPSLTVYTPPKGLANGTAIVIAAGGGHSELVVGEEGFKPAEYLSKQGITAFVLKYRLAREKDSGLTIEKDCRADAYRAMRMVRSLAGNYGIDPKRVGMMGFSAGGEVVSMAAFNTDPADSKAADPVDRLDATPNFAVWIYPGPVGIPNEIPATSPPAFFLVAADDGASRVISDLTAKYQKAKIPYETHILRSGGHGFNMGDRSKLESVKTWPLRLVDWLKDSGYLTRS